MKLPPFTQGLAGVLVLIAVFTFGRCEGRSEQRLDAAGDTTDAARARMAGDVVELEARVRHDSAARVEERRSTAAATAAAHRRSDSLEAALRARGPLSPDVEEVLAAQHATITALEADTLALRGHLVFWQGVARERAAQRDSALAIADEYRVQRDAWRKKALSRCGPDVAAGLAALGGFDVVAGFGCRIPLPF